MKSSFKYVIVLVILSLSGLFIYQLFWITGLYHSRQKQNQEEIRMAIKNADHIELFNRADFLSRVTHRQRETSAIADTKGGAALSTRFPDKDSVIPELSVQPLDTNIYHPRYRSQTLRNEAGKMLKSTAVEVGNDFRSLGELGLQMQQALHEVIDSVKPVDLAKFDSILSSHLQKRGLDIRHHTEMWNLEDSSIIASSVPADLDKTEYDLHKWEYTTYHKRAYLVYTEPTRWDTIRMMSGILFSSFLILLILILSFAYMFWFLIHQKTVEQLKDDFTHNVTHELKTPIAITYAAIEAMIHYNITGNKEKTNKYLHICHEEVLRLGNMVEQILSLGLERKKDFKLKYERVDLNGLLDKIVEQQSIKSSKPFHVGLESMPDRIILEADRTHLYNILSNILDNAIKFTPAGGTIKFHVEKLGPEVEISIWNSGQGISPEALPYVFQRFYKEDRSRGLHARGAGLGLNICKVLVNLSGGQIRVESQQGEWCQFVFTLPATPPNPSGMKRLPDESGQPVPVEDPASMKPVN